MAAARRAKFKVAYCQEVIACLAEGHSVTAFAGRIGVARSTLSAWADDHPDFAEAMEIGQAKAVEFWEAALIRIAREGKGNATAAMFGLKNRAPGEWRDRHDHEHTGELKITRIESVIVDPQNPDG